MKATGSCIIWLGLAILLPVSHSIAVTDKTATACPVLKTEGHQFSYQENLDVSGFDLTQSFSLRQTSCGVGKPCFKLGNAPLIRDSQKVFPNGIPEEYFLTATFRVRRNSKRERWYLLQILDQHNMPQVYITIDGTKKL
uniref:collagen alpha-1(XIX) chain-like n=1 Tax=Podarcis muralis TaxID=64176 RepID=UPI0010A05C55|nr:collagen alpha-1(XIX) chain-like [Podarcis muralis]XP_028578522.1 collagen alpha-1(XIX) chain-like [Podarcis muralis]